MKKDEINIDLNENQLTVSGERKFENERKDRNFHNVESYYGSFSRSFYLPEIVNQEKVNAAYENGILSITLPKDTKKVNKRQISVK
jgi:HSP20 family protein